MASRLYNPYAHDKDHKIQNNINNCSSPKNGIDSIFRDFVWFTSDGPDIDISTNANNPSRIAQVQLFGLQQGDEIWLNGLFHMDCNLVNDRASFNVIIFKNGEEIYNQPLRIDSDNRDDLIPVPVMTVDTQSVAGSATYILAVVSDRPSTRVFRFRTFTATLIRRG